MQTLIPPEAAEYVTTQRTADLLAASRNARGRYYDTPLTADDAYGATSWLHAVAVMETELARRGIRVIASGPDLGPDPALDPRPEDIPESEVDGDR